MTTQQLEPASPGASAEVQHVSLFEGADVALDVHDGGHPWTIITFESRDRRLPLDGSAPFGPGFGRGRFASLGFNEYLIKRNRNHWYQTAEMDRVAEIVRSRTQGTRSLTYGSSMGAFAAVNFVEMLDADEFVALSPLHDVAPGNEADERRWPEPASLDFTRNLIRDGAVRDRHGYVFFAGIADEVHARLIGRDTAASVIEVPYGGHPCSFFLNEAYGIKRILTQVASGEFDAALFTQELAAAAEQTYYPYEVRAAAAARERDLPGALEQMRLAIARRPSLARLHDRLGDLLRRTGDLTGAQAAFEQSLALSPHGTAAHIGLSYVHAAREDYAAAVRAVDDALAIAPKPEYHARRGEWLIRQGDLVQAEQAMLTVIELVPDAVVAPRRLAEIRALMASRADDRRDRAAHARWSPGALLRRRSAR